MGQFFSVSHCVATFYWCKGDENKKLRCRKGWDSRIFLQILLESRKDDMFVVVAQFQWT